MLSPDVWREFAFDPRDPSYAAMRAGTADRNVVLQSLSEAYAQGQLDRDELDERVDTANGAKTLGELPVLLADLLPSPGVVALTSTADVRAEAVAKYERTRREALMSFLTPTLICWAIWLAIMWGDWSFPWPIFVTVPTGLGYVSTLIRKQDIIESNEKKILKKRAAQARELPPGDPA